MFDVGFWEISVLLVVMLLVVGPERLPGLARKAGLWIGKARRIVAEVRSEIDRELQIEEIKSSIKQETHLEDFRQLAEEVRTIESDIRTEVRTIESDIESRSDKPSSTTGGLSDRKDTTLDTEPAAPQHKLTTPEEHREVAAETPPKSPIK